MYLTPATVCVLTTKFIATHNHCEYITLFSYIAYANKYQINLFTLATAFSNKIRPSQSTDKTISIAISLVYLV